MRQALHAVAVAVALAGPAAAACRTVALPPDPPLNACAGPERVTLAAVGDVLLHARLQRRGYAEGFGAIWAEAAPLLAGADIAVANFEGPAAPGLARGGRAAREPGPAFDDVVYSSYPLFNYHPIVIDDLRAAGVRLVSTANNHALDRGPRGADATVAQMVAREMLQTGVIRAGSARDFAVRLDTPLGRIAFIACSYSTNGIADPHRQVLMCFEGRDELLAAVRAEAARPGVAGVIVLPHWGTEYSHVPEARQRALAHELAAAGALAVIGAHPHVVQPWEEIPRPGGGRALVVHSTGNFVSGQVTLPRQTGMLAWLELCRPAAEGGFAAGDAGAGWEAPRLAVAVAGWVPLLMARPAAGPQLVIPAPGAGGAEGAARALIERHVPGREAALGQACTSAALPDLTLQ